MVNATFSMMNWRWRKSLWKRNRSEHCFEKRNIMGRKINVPLASTKRRNQKHGLGIVVYPKESVNSDPPFGWRWSKKDHLLCWSHPSPVDLCAVLNSRSTVLDPPEFWPNSKISLHNLIRANDGFPYVIIMCRLEISENYITLRLY